MVRLLLELPEYVNLRDHLVTDFKSTLISRTKLGKELLEAEIKYKKENEDEPLPDAKTYKLRLEDTGTLTVAQLTAYLASTNGDTDSVDKEPIIQALNIFLGHHAKSSSRLATIGRNKSFPLDENPPGRSLGAGLTAIRGFFSSVRVATSRILVNVNVTHGAFYDAIPLDQLIQKYGNTVQFNRFRLESFIKKLKVKVIHLPEKKNKAGQPIVRVKTIFSLANKNDGQGMDHPPKVQSHGAGSKEVEFFLDHSAGAPSGASTKPAGAQPGSSKKSKGKQNGGSGGKPSQSSSNGKYVTVYEYFRTGKFMSPDRVNLV